MNKKNLIDTRSARVLVVGDSIPANIFRVFPKSYCSFAVSGDTVQDVGWKFGDVRIPANIKCVVLHVVFNDVLQGHGFCQIVCQYEVRFGPKKYHTRPILFSQLRLRDEQCSVVTIEQRYERENTLETLFELEDMGIVCNDHQPPSLNFTPQLWVAPFL